MKSLVQFVMESKVPSYDNPVFIDCESEKDADAKVEIGYSDYSSSLFYVGEVGTDNGAALEAVVSYLKKHNLIDHYTADDDMAEEYPEDCIEIEGVMLPSDKVYIETLVNNHGGRK